MGIKKNPFGVGVSGNDVVRFRATCPCCRIDFSYASPRTANVVPNRCPCCLDHDLAGSGADRITALEDHAARALERARAATDTARSMAGERDVALDDNKAVKSSAYRSHKRREWAEQLLEAVLAVHAEGADGTCSCGLSAPCLTRQAEEDFKRRHPHPDYSGFIYEVPRPRTQLRRPVPLTGAPRGRGGGPQDASPRPGRE